MTCRRSKVFYSSNKDITLGEVIFSNYIRKIESQLSWPGSSLGHQQSRGCRGLYCTSKKKKDLKALCSHWAPGPYLQEQPGRSLGIFWEWQALLGCSLTPWTPLFSSKNRLCGYCHSGSECLVGTIMLRLLFLVSLLGISTLLQNLLWFQKTPQHFSLLSLCALSHLSCTYIISLP